jgi:L-threonylcarbamoyladenylate synthase
VSARDDAAGDGPTTDDRRRTERLEPDAEGIARAAALLRAGELVAFPTETVYGLGARADDARAVDRVFTAKGRPSDNPLIVHVPSVDALERVAGEVTPLARTLLDRFAPGPLTLVLRARPDLPRRVTAGLDTVAVRIPAHPVALMLLRALDLPLAAPSANRSTRPSPTTAAHVLADLDGLIAAVLDAGATDVGLESTVVDARGARPVVLREGAVTREDLAALSGIDHDAVGPAGGIDDAHRSPGTRHAHYAPRMPVHVADPGHGDELLAHLLTAPSLTSTARIGLVRVSDSGTTTTGSQRPSLPPAGLLLAELEGPAALASQLFALLRAAEDAGCVALIVEGVAPVGIGRAVMDRLARAAAGPSPV